MIIFHHISQYDGVGNHCDDEPTSYCTCSLADALSVHVVPDSPLLSHFLFTVDGRKLLNWKQWIVGKVLWRWFVGWSPHMSLKRCSPPLICVFYMLHFEESSSRLEVFQIKGKYWPFWSWVYAPPYYYTFLPAYVSSLNWYNNITHRSRCSNTLCRSWSGDILHIDWRLPAAVTFNKYNPVFRLLRMSQW